MDKDEIYAQPVADRQPFTFNESVVRVFDDMLTRSIPHYREILLLQAEMAETGYQPGTRIYDLGCSTGNLALLICERLADRAFHLTAVDSSPPMIDTFTKRFHKTSWADRITPVCDDIRNIVFEAASVVIVNFTLQFISLSDRKELIEKIFQALRPGGVLLVSEKIIHQDPALSRMQQDFHDAFKKENGYSDLEISQKRDALENVLVPETVESHLKRFQKTGFHHIDVWYKWFNFISIICRKDKA